MARGCILRADFRRLSLQIIPSIPLSLRMEVVPMKKKFSMKVGETTTLGPVQPNQGKVK